VVRLKVTAAQLQTLANGDGADNPGGNDVFIELFSLDNGDLFVHDNDSRNEEGSGVWLDKDGHYHYG
jgi:hypothetical protein